jgi:hypothetical protein
MSKHANWMSVYDAKSYTRTIQGLIGQAEAMMREDVASGKFRDVGSCVLGAGLAIEYRHPRKRKSELMVVIHAPYHGNVGSYQACERAMKFLKENGVNVEWYDGILD